ncbi:MAG TPA: PAS domain-containing protein [Terriglobia bacterium]|nr:PAS domain-containing protein [Terriglobia bacterium]
MALFHNAAQPVWQADRWGFSGKAERDLRDLSHASLLVFAMAAVATGVVAGILMSSDFGIVVSWSYIAVVILFPLLSGLLVKEIWHVRKLESQVRRQQTEIGFVGSALSCGDGAPAGLLIVSPDLRVRFANQQYLDTMLQRSEEVLGWKMQDVLSADGLEDQAKILLGRSDPAASCCFNIVVRTSLGGDRSVHITMTRIAPRQGEDRILVIIEELLPGSSLRLGEPVEGYVC